MTKQEDKLFGAKILGIASGVRRVVLFGNQRIAEAIEESPYDEYELESLLELTHLLMMGYEREHIIDSLQIPQELVERFDKMDLNW